MESKQRLASLRSANDFATLKKIGRTFHPAPWLMVSFRKVDSTSVRGAWTISRKTGSAVVRNRLKRWSREYLRPWAAEFGGGIDFNLIFKPQAKDFYKNLKHSELDRVLTKVVSRLGNP